MAGHPGSPAPEYRGEVAPLKVLATGQLADGEYLELMRAHPSQLTDLVVGPEQRLFVSSEDIAEFYHSLLWPVVRWTEIAVGPLLRPSELLAFARNEPMPPCSPA